MIRCLRRRPVRLAAIAAGGVLVGAVLAAAQGRGGFGGFGFGGGSGAPIAPNVGYDGRFTFVRLRYGPPIPYQTQRVPWSHDYPEGEHNLMKILTEISDLGPRIEETNVMALDDPELCKFPVAYMAEPGRWYMTDDEAKSFRAYLLKGGFAIFDDFRRRDWDNFEAQIRRVLPEARFVELTGEHPIFHAFFEIPHPELDAQYYDRGEPIFRGIYEDNDPQKRLMVVAAYNTDISEFWEWSGTGFKPITESNEAFKVGVNFFMYGLTH